VRVALMIEGQEGVTWEQWLALARTAEAAGIEALFRSDHYLGIARDGDGGSLDAWTTLAGLAASTERIRLGTLVSPVTFRPASVLAKSVATADHISGGRVELGIGAGWFEAEHELYDLPFLTAGERVGLLRRQLDAIVRQWTEAPQVQPKPVQKPHPPVLVGGSGRRGTVEPAVRWATEYNTTRASVEACRSIRETLDRACEAAGRDPATLPLSLMCTCIVGTDEADLREHVRRYAEIYGRGASVDDVLAGVTPDDLIGTVDVVAARLRTFEEAGVLRVMLRNNVHEDLEQTDHIGRELAPAVA
jgi:alkanesulfonate monooxygenase SsuD/methylene tetrahydromethanopterin reductase-like flavin-dependent oxidoreductase (luciferase family)